jgi:hypothetical protein
MRAAISVLVVMAGCSSSSTPAVDAPTGSSPDAPGSSADAPGSSPDAPGSSADAPGSSAGADAPPAGPDAGPQQHLYVGIGETSILVYDLPVTSSSVAKVTLPEAGMNAMCARAGTLYAVVTAPMGNWRVDAFAEPLAANSTPLFSLKTTYASRDCKLDAAGNLFVVANQSDTEGVFVYHAPIVAQSTPVKTLTATNLQGPYGIAIDGHGDLFTAGRTITEFGPYASGNAVLASFGADPNNEGIVIAPDGSLFVPNGNGIDVYLPAQFKDGTVAPDHTIGFADYLYLDYADFDAAQNLYVTGTDSTNHNFVIVRAKPYTGAPIATIPLPDWGSGVLIGP